MPTEKLVIYLVVGAILLVKFLADVLQRWREHQLAQRAAHEPDAHERGAGRWEPLREAARGESSIDAVSSRLPLPRPAERSASRPTHPKGAQAAARLPTPLHVEAPLRHRIALGNRAELRRAVELMAILGPPRSRAPDDV